MHSPDLKAPPLAVWALGVTQIIGYGTLYYSFAILAPDMARDLDLPHQWVFGALSLALFLASLLAPTAGRLADKFGAGRVMTAGSAAAALALCAVALAPERISFVLALVAMELASCFVLYATAFVAIVQSGPVGAQRSITHLTLIAGFASTLFWPITTWLHGYLDWREVYFVFAGMNLAFCMPLHAWLVRLSRRRQAARSILPVHKLAPEPTSSSDGARIKLIFILMLAGFAVEGFVLSAILQHMVPLITALGLGAAGTLVSTLFGPSQVASRLVNMVFGERLPQTVLAIIATLLLATGLAVVLAAAPSLAGIAAFVVLFGLGSGLMSIVGGTLPLEMFGRHGYGSRVGWMSAARQFSSSFAPFVLALMMARVSVPMSVAALLAVGLVGTAVFIAIAMAVRGSVADTVAV